MPFISGDAGDPQDLLPKQPGHEGPSAPRDKPASHLLWSLDPARELLCLPQNGTSSTNRGFFPVSCAPAASRATVELYILGQQALGFAPSGSTPSFYLNITPRRTKQATSPDHKRGNSAGSWNQRQLGLHLPRQRSPPLRPERQHLRAGSGAEGRQSRMDSTEPNTKGSRRQAENESVERGCRKRRNKRAKKDNKVHWGKEAKRNTHDSLKVQYTWCPKPKCNHHAETPPQVRLPFTQHWTTQLLGQSLNSRLS